MSRLDIWADGLSDSMQEHGVTATPEQVRAIATDLMHHAEAEHEQYSGPISDPRDREISDLKTKLAHERDKIACTPCKGTGRIVTQGPSHGGNSQCHRCQGEGKHHPMRLGVHP